MKSKPRTKAGDGGGNLVKIITAYIPMNRIPRRFEGNIRKYAVEGRVTARR
jgi:hypothetical protein